MRRVALGFCEQRLYVLAQSLGFGYRSSDALVQDKRIGHVGKHRLAVRSRTAEVVERFTVTHKKEKNVCLRTTTTAESAFRLPSH